MSDLTKWLPLWEKCPELRPKNLIIRHMRAIPEQCMPYQTLPDGEHIIDRDWASALIRDRAVWWLAYRSDTEFVIHDARGNDTPGEVTIFYGHNEQWVEANDPTEALRLACCKVLGVEA